MRAFLLILLASPAIAAPWAPYQLHPRRFAACLRDVVPRADIQSATDLGKVHGLNSLDLILVHLAVYPGVQVPAFSSLVQSKARSWWSDRWNIQEEKLAEAVGDYGTRSKTLVPRALFAEAIRACGKEDFFCAALVAHNTLRALGRHPQGVHTHLFTRKQTDYNPAWFRKERNKWLGLIPLIQTSFVPLRADGGGDRWGEWYHFFGILTYAVHEAALGKRPASIDFVVRMNELLNPALAGGKEEPEKARLDRDSIEVAQWFLTDKNPPKVDCSRGETYTAGRWDDEPEPFPLEGP